jgi:muconolactone delta-isomerase
MEYLVTMTTHVPDGTPEPAIDDIRAREAAHSRELAAAGHPSPALGVDARAGDRSGLRIAVCGRKDQISGRWTS